MKLVWSPDRASKAYIDTVKSVSSIHLFMNHIIFNIFIRFLFLKKINKLNYLFSSVRNLRRIRRRGASLRHGRRLECQTHRRDLVRRRSSSYERRPRHRRRTHRRTPSLHRRRRTVKIEVRGGDAEGRSHIAARSGDRRRWGGGGGGGGGGFSGGGF